MTFARIILQLQKRWNSSVENTEVVSINETVVRKITVCVVGSFIYATGVCIMTRAMLGISPISSLPYVISLISGLTLGTCMMIFNVAMIIIQKAALGKEFTLKIMVSQISLSLIFSVFIDLTIYIFGGFSPQNYIGKMVYLLFGCVVLALGVSLVVMAKIAILPGDGAAQVISKKLKREFGTGKVMFDSTCVVLSIILSLTCLGGIQGVREGTVISTLLIGTCAKFIMRCFGRPVEGFINGKSEAEPGTVTTEK